jgi:hypothetical protein
MGTEPTSTESKAALDVAAVEAEIFREKERRAQAEKWDYIPTDLNVSVATLLRALVNNYPNLRSADELAAETNCLVSTVKTNVTTLRRMLKGTMYMIMRKKESRDTPVRYGLAIVES